MIFMLTPLGCARARGRGFVALRGHFRRRELFPIARRPMCVEFDGRAIVSN